MVKKDKIVFLVGPTAIGKTKTALSLVKKANLEIISCDSMQIYKGMDIITSKPTGNELKKIPYHLVNITSAKEEYNVSEYCSNALKTINKILKCNKIPLFVGGTGLYVMALVDGLFQGGNKNSKARKRLEDIAKNKGRSFLYKRLLRVDRKAATKIHPNDLKRIIRALEVYEVTGKPISELQTKRRGLREKFDVRIIGLNMERTALYERIDSRVDEMFDNGLLREVKKLLKKKLSKTARFAIGLREIDGYLKGKYDLGEAKRLIKRNTRRYAKRQLSWFRKDKNIRWVNISKNEKKGSLVNKVLKEIRGRS